MFVFLNTWRALSYYRRFHLFEENISHLMATAIQRMVQRETVENDFLGNRKIESTKSFCGKHCKKMKFSIKDFVSKYDQVRSFPIWSHLLTNFLMENFVFLRSENVNNNTVMGVAFKPLSANLNGQTQLLPTNCFNVFDHFVGLALKVLNKIQCTKN